MIADAVAANMSSTGQIKEDYGSKENRSVRLIGHRLPSLVIGKTKTIYCDSGEKINGESFVLPANIKNRINDELSIDAMVEV